MIVPFHLQVMDALWSLEHQMFLVGGKFGLQHTGFLLANTDYTVLTLRFSRIGSGKIVSFATATSGPCAVGGTCTGVGPPPDPVHMPVDRTVSLFCQTAQLSVSAGQLAVRSSNVLDPPFGPIKIFASANDALSGIIGHYGDPEQVYWLLEFVQVQIWRGDPAAHQPFAPGPQAALALTPGTFLTIPMAVTLAATASSLIGAAGQ
jgi:hypothetical protein